MAVQTYNVKLKGKAQLHEPVVKLEGVMINLWSADGGETWTNKKVNVDLTGNLEVFMSCKSLSGTSWEFVIQNITNPTNKKKVVDEEGTTGDDGTPNYSEYSGSVNP
jgi:hypothetical protein